MSRPALSRIKEFFPDATKIIDAKRSATIEVLKRDRQGAQRKSFDNCAMARACVRSMNVDGALISLSAAYIQKGPVVTRYMVPVSLQKEIVAADRAGMEMFSPGEYRLRAPHPSQRLGSVRNRDHAENGTARRKRKRRHHLTEGVRRMA